jgi:hypothetical protein
LRRRCCDAKDSPFGKGGLRGIFLGNVKTVGDAVNLP